MVVRSVLGKKMAFIFYPLVMCPFILMYQKNAQSNISEAEYSRVINICERFESVVALYTMVKTIFGTSFEL